MSAVVLLWTVASDIPATGSDATASIPLKAAPALAAYDWTGFYLGGHFGYGTGSLIEPQYQSRAIAGRILPAQRHRYDRRLPGRLQLATDEQVVLGVEADISFGWTAKAEYDYVDLARRTYDLTDVGLPRVNVDPNIHLIKLGLNYRFWEMPPWAGSTPVNGPTPVNGQPALAEPANWNVHCLLEINLANALRASRSVLLAGFFISSPSTADRQAGRWAALGHRHQ